MESPEVDEVSSSYHMVARRLPFVNSIFVCTHWLFEWKGLVRMRAEEVVGAEGVGEGVSGLIRLWKCVENGSRGWRLEVRRKQKSARLQKQEDCATRLQR